MDHIKKHLTTYQRYLDRSRRQASSMLVGVVVVVGVASLGAYLIHSGHADTVTIGIPAEAESGPPTGVATMVADPSASAGGAIKFGTYSNPPAILKTGELSVYIESNEDTEVPLCLDDKGNATANNNPVVANPCSATSPEQQWSLYTDNTIHINGKCLSPSGNGTADGTAVVINTCTAASTSQQWAAGADASVSLNDLVNASSKKCLNLPGVTADFPDYDANDNNVLNGTALNIVSCNGSLAEQVWGWNTSGTILPGGSTAGANCNYASVSYKGFGECYWEAHGVQQRPFNATGYSVNITQASPKTPVYEHNNIATHSVNEVWAGGGGTGTGGTVNIGDSIPGDAVEFGWMKDGDGNPSHLFVTYWQNGALKCEEEGPGQDCGFVSTNSIKPGSAVTSGVIGTYKVVYASSQWQFWYNGAEIGYFPASLWTSQGDTSFTSISYLDLYGEVAVPLEIVSKTQMGNGILGSQPGSTAFGNLSLIGSSSAADLTFNGNQPPLPWLYAYNRGNTSSTGFSVGGPGL